MDLELLENAKAPLASVRYYISTDQRRDGTAIHPMEEKLSGKTAICCSCFTSSVSDDCSSHTVSSITAAVPMASRRYNGLKGDWL